MKISNLKPSITQLSYEEAFALVKETRFQRRQFPVKKATVKNKRIQKPMTTKAVVNALSDEQKLQLLKDLGGV